LGQNKYLRNILLGKSTINLDKHLNEGGILIVNTAMGELGNLGDTFGKFVIMHIQNAVFRRKGLNEFERPYHHLWIDEAPRYMNPDFERLLAIGRGFRCSVNMALQSLDQLSLEEKTVFKNIVLTNCRNQVIFGGLAKDDALYFEEALGKDEKQTRQYTYKYNTLVPINLLPKQYRTTKKDEVRFRYTDIMEMPASREKADVIIKYVVFGSLQKPERVVTYLHKYKKPDKLKELEKKAQDEYWSILSENKHKAKDIPQKITSLPDDISKNDKVVKVFGFFDNLLEKIKSSRRNQTAEETTVTTIVKEPLSYEFSEADNLNTKQETTRVKESLELDSEVEEVNPMPKMEPKVEAATSGDDSKKERPAEKDEKSIKKAEVSGTAIKEKKQNTGREIQRKAKKDPSIPALSEETIKQNVQHTLKENVAPDITVQTTPDGKKDDGSWWG